MSVATELAAMRALFERPRREAIQARVSQGEIPDPIPLEMPIGMEQPPSMRELVQEYVRSEMSQQAAEADMGTFEEEDDFDEEDEALLDLSGFEVHEFEMVDEDPEGVPGPDPDVRESGEASSEGSTPETETSAVKAEE